MPSQLWTTLETIGDDFLTGVGGDSVLNGSDGDDYILGDSHPLYYTGTSNSLVSPANIDESTAWRADENPFIASSIYLPHTTLYVVADAGQEHYSSVTVGGAQTIMIDIDFGAHVIGTYGDLVVTLYEPGGAVVTLNDFSSTTAGDAGSTSTADSFLTFVNETGAPVTYTIGFSRSFGGAFAGGETFVANISVGGHEVLAPTPMGADILSGGNGDDTIAGQGGNDILNGNQGNDTLFGGSGSDRLEGGVGIDEMLGGSGDDNYIVDNEADNVVETAFEGTDHVRSSISYALSTNVENLTLFGPDAIDGVGNNAVNVLTGNAAANVLMGLGGNDRLIGGAGADTMYGGTGNDQIDGGLGIDKLTGGTGADKFVFDSAPGGTDHDNITDFSVADDTIVLDRSIFTDFASNGTLASASFFAGTAAHDGNDRIIYNSATGNIYYDADGSRVGAQVLIAHLTTGLVLTNADFLLVS